MNKETEELKRLKTAADTWQLQRIADALEEILRLVKQDMQKYEKKKAN
jgi:outer membrane protein assembly factor BamD (BamD/ComL family)